MRRFQLVQNMGQRIPSMQLGDGRNGKRRCGFVRPVVDDPFQDVLSAGSRLIEAFGRPQHPVPLGRVAFFVRKDLQGQKLASVIGAMPTDRAVAIGRDDQAPILAGIRRPNLAST
jgi:hypothetical protein